MTNDEEFLKKRFLELARRAAARDIWTYSEFLTLAEQDTLARMQRSLDAPCALWGGFDAAERKLAAFGEESRCGYPAAYPLVYVELRPKSPKFAEALTHRDYLGALMSLGMRREVLGDLQLTQTGASLVCLESAAAYLCENCVKARHTDLVCAQTDAPAASVAAPPEVQYLVVASERLDALVGAVFRLSRSEARALVESGVVFVDARLTESAAFTPTAGSIVSVRGHGRFLYEGIDRATKKERLRVGVRIYG
ncbi:MAG: YlmH/Sll1252 family protein [Oscillospiraceae bacterium]|nr:YlmH/Sll1252 family protein [Oscillospiraceae bacterium]